MGKLSKHFHICEGSYSGFLLVEEVPLHSILFANFTHHFLQNKNQTLHVLELVCCVFQNPPKSRKTPVSY